MNFRSPALEAPEAAERDEAAEIAARVAASAAARAQERADIERGRALLEAARPAWAVAWIVAERQLKRGDLSGSGYQLPALETLDRAAWRATVAGVIFLAIGLLWGAVANHDQFLAHIRGDAKAVMSLVTLLFYGTLLALRDRGMRGKRFAILLLAGYTVLFFTFYLVNLYWGGHPLASGGAG
ncbi:MAG: cytochrome c biogenesis protein CcsA [candidate division FCPU426 bacterium]